MAKGLRSIHEKALLADLFIVVLDGRAPLSSYNYELDKIYPNKPRLILITKSDLSNKTKINQVVDQLKSKNSEVLILNLKDASSKKMIFSKLNLFLQQKVDKLKNKGFINTDLKIFVVGIPNGGKSTLINLLTKSKLKTANIPGVTRSNQWINVGNFMFLDTPGIMFPKIEDQTNGFKLIILNAIPIDIFDLKFLTINIYKLISNCCSNILSELNLEPSEDDSIIEKNLEKLAKLKNFSSKNGFDLNKTMYWFINFIKNQKLFLD